MNVLRVNFHSAPIPVWEDRAAEAWPLQPRSWPPQISCLQGWAKVQKYEDPPGSQGFTKTLHYLKNKRTWTSAESKCSMPVAVPWTVLGKVRACCQRSQEMAHDFIINAGWNIISKKHWQSEQDAFTTVAITTVWGGATFGDYTSIIQKWSFWVCSSFW